jgi:acetylornithine deacetylase/succinyl-diaminopimelate desuccinylase-like protein
LGRDYWSYLWSPKKALLERIDRDRELLITFLQEFIRCPTPHPPGDTRIAARHVQKLLDAHGVAYRIIAPNLIMPNMVANFSGPNQDGILPSTGTETFSQPAPVKAGLMTLEAATLSMARSAAAVPAI